MMMRAMLLLWLIAGLTVKVNGLEVYAEQADETALSILLTGVELPASVVTELGNGLPNHIDLVVNIVTGDRVYRSAMVSYEVTYDLWDEAYIIDMELHNVEIRNKPEHLVAKTEHELLAFLSSARLTVPVSSRPPTAARIQAEIIVNPVQKERVEKIKQWLDKRGSYNRNNTDVAAESGSPNDAAGFDASRLGGVRSTGPRFQKLFDRILDQYAASDDVVAQWRSGNVEVLIHTSQPSEQEK